MAEHLVRLPEGEADDRAAELEEEADEAEVEAGAGALAVDLAVLFDVGAAGRDHAPLVFRRGSPLVTPAVLRRGGGVDAAGHIRRLALLVGRVYFVRVGAPSSQQPQPTAPAGAAAERKW